MDKPHAYYAFQVLYWCGLHEGEMLALTPADFDFKNNTVRINKTYQRLHGEDIITPTKTKKSNRTIKMPQFLCDEIQEYIATSYGLRKKDRLFIVTKSQLEREMQRGSEAAGVKKIRIHDLRHPYVKHTTKNISLQKQKSQTTNRFDSLGFLFSLNAMPSIKLIIVISANQKSS